MLTFRFPSPTGATYYELYQSYPGCWAFEVSVPNRGYLLWMIYHFRLYHFGSQFPSPTGATYYESYWNSNRKKDKKTVSVPNRGYLLWIGICFLADTHTYIESFRPQQGLPIMNRYKTSLTEKFLEFPSPTGATYYES